MEITANPDSLKIGVDNAITEALQTGNWGVRLSFRGEQFDSRYEVVLTVEQAGILIENITKALEGIKLVTKPITPQMELVGGI